VEVAWDAEEEVLSVSEVFLVLNYLNKKYPRQLGFRYKAVHLHASKVN